MGTLVEIGFHRRPTFEEILLKPGGVAQAPYRPWTRLREDPKLNAFVGATLDELRQMELKAHAAYFREHMVRQRAAEEGISVGEARLKTGPPPSNMPRAEVDPSHGEKVSRSEQHKDMEHMGLELEKERRRAEARDKFDETLAPPGSIAEAYVTTAEMAGEFAGRGFEGAVGLATAGQ